jgi:hypothetical protein
MRVIEFTGALIIAASAVMLGSCGNANVTPASQAPPVPSPTPTPQAANLYVEYNATLGGGSADGIAVYPLTLPSPGALLPPGSPAPLPLASPAVPSLRIPGPLEAIAFDPIGNMYTVATDGETILEYPYPFGPSTVARPVILPGPATIPTPTSFISDLAFDSFGDLWAQTNFDLREFSPPFTAATIAQTVLSGGGSNQLIFSGSGKLYAGPMSVPFGATATIQIYNPYPYTLPPKKISNVGFGEPMGFFPDGTVVVSATGANIEGELQPQPPGLEIVSSSLSSSTMAPFIIPFTIAKDPVGHPGAVDPDGNAYILDGSANNAVDVYAFPIVAGAKPEMQIPCVQVAGACETPVGVYVGP